MDSFIARQPIFDTDMNVYGYELLYRSDAVKNSFDMYNNLDIASAKIIMDSFHGIGIERLTGGKRAFINFTANLLEQGAATLFPRETLAVEVLENVKPTAKIVENLKKLRAGGYLIVLDDYAYSNENRSLLALADIVKVDFMAMAAEQIRRTVAEVKNGHCRLLAEKVEDTQKFELAKALGFTLFQGYFFAMPVIVSNRRIEPTKQSYLHLMREIWQEDDLNYPRLASVIKSDMALSYKMLRLVNSAYYAQCREIKDILHALVILGDVVIRKWVSLIALAGYGSGRPDELTRKSLVCARFMELYATGRGLPPPDVETMFLSGLFSFIDVILQQPMRELLSKLSIPVKVGRALIYGEGEIAILLKILRAYDDGDWNTVNRLCAELSQPIPNFDKLHLEAIDWCGTILAA